MCAGCAQVTLVECHESYKPGCNRTGEETTRNKPPQNPTQPKPTQKRKGEQPVVQLEVPGRHERVKQGQ